MDEDGVVLYKIKEKKIFTREYYIFQKLKLLLILF